MHRGTGTSGICGTGIIESRSDSIKCSFLTDTRIGLRRRARLFLVAGPTGAM